MKLYNFHNSGNFFSLLKDEARDVNENGYNLAESAGEDEDWNESTYLAIAIGNIFYHVLLVRNNIQL